MKYKTQYPAYLMVLIVLLSCTKKEDHLVPITMTGQNTMGFKMDGNNYNLSGCYDFRCFLYCPGVSSNYLYGEVTVRGLIDGFMEIYLKANIDTSFRLGDTLFLGNFNKGPHAGLVFKGTDGGFFKTDSIHSGFWVITSLEENSSSGMFQFDCISTQGSTIRTLRHGRYDIHCP